MEEIKNIHKYNCNKYIYKDKVITEITSVNRENHWFEVHIPLYGIKRFNTALEVKNYIGGKPTLVGSYELWYTPVGRPIKKNCEGM